MCNPAMASGDRFSGDLVHLTANAAGSKMIRILPGQPGMFFSISGLDNRLLVACAMRSGLFGGTRWRSVISSLKL
jgi:hypothetical protein